MVQKLVELLITALPKLSRIAVLTNPSNASHPTMLLRVQSAAQQSGRKVFPVGVRTAEDIEHGFATMARERADAVIILIDAFLLQQESGLSLAEIAALQGVGVETVKSRLRYAVAKLREGLQEYA